MKKNSLLRYLYFMSFVFVFQCTQDSESNSIINPSEACEEITCDVNINDFKIKISVSMVPYDNELLETISDSENYFGVLENATDEYDPIYDLLEPINSPGNWISLYFPHPEWGHDLGDNFTQDIRGNILQDQENRVIEWNFNIESNAYGVIDLDFEMLDDYCYDCINFIQLTVDEEVYTSDGINFNNINISKFLQQNQKLSINLILNFNP